MFFSCAGMAAALTILGIHMASIPVEERHSSGCSVASVASTSGNDDSSSPFLPVSALALYLMAFSLGMGPGAWLIPSEVFPNSVRAKAMSMATVSNRIAATFMASSFLTFAKLLSYSGVLFTLALITVGTGAFFFVYLPETKGRSLEQMLDYFETITKSADSLQISSNNQPVERSATVPSQNEALSPMRSDQIDSDTSRDIVHSRP